MLPLQHIIFREITSDEYLDMSATGGIRTSEYKKDAVILHTGDRTKEFGILLSGKAHIENTGLWGNRVILHSLSAHDAFAETYAVCDVPMMADVTAALDCRILFINTGILLSPEQHTKSWYFKLIYNLLRLSTNKNLAWSNRIFCMTAKGIRAKVMTYLSSEYLKHESKNFSITFDRQQMADYLNVERSALSKELAKMKKEGILDFHKNHFRLLKTDPV